MQLLSIIFLLTGITSATPLRLDPASLHLVSRDAGIVRNELQDGNGTECPKAIFIFARATTEALNMGITTGPVVAQELEEQYEKEYEAESGNKKNKFWVQGVGIPYTADIRSNDNDNRTSQNAIDEAKRLFELADTKCPGTPIVAGGYSQGTAVIAGAIPSLSPALKNKIKGVILFGYSLNKQKNGGIPDFPKDKVEVYCHTGDLVCDGQLQPTPEHLNYIDEAKNDAPKFLIGKLGRLEGN